MSASPRKRPSAIKLRSDASCQSRPNAPQQKAPLFDHLVGNSEERRRHGEAERLRGLEIDDQIEFGRLHEWQITVSKFWRRRFQPADARPQCWLHSSLGRLP